MRPTPRGICVDGEGNVYVVTVAVNKPETAEGTLIVFDSKGKHLRTVRIHGSSRLLLDIRFHPQTGKLLVVDYQAAKLLTVDPQTGASSVFMTVTGKDPGLDAFRFDAAGNVYTTDAPGHYLESGQRRRQGDGLGRKPVSQADKAAARHRREWGVVQ